MITGERKTISGRFTEFHHVCACGTDLGWIEEARSEYLRCRSCQAAWQIASDAEHVRAAAESLRSVRAHEAFDRDCG